MENISHKKETREEYNARKTQGKEQEEKTKEGVKEMVGAMMKANQCPECKNVQLKKFSRKNYPFGKKSKPISTTGKRCPNCGYIKIKAKNDTR